MFGPNRIYLDVKKMIGTKAKSNIPDGYLIDLSSAKEPVLRVVENELASHDPLRHVAVQIIEFSLAFEDAPYKVKSVVRAALQADAEALKKCERYAKANNFENVDVLLDRMIHEGEFAALVVIDDLREKLDSVLAKKFKFGVEVLTLARYANDSGEYIYEFEPFLVDVVQSGTELGSDESVDLSDIDTVVVPAQDEGFEQAFMAENRWYKVRIHGSMIPKLRACCTRTAPRHHKPCNGELRSMSSVRTESSVGGFRCRSPETRVRTRGSVRVRVIRGALEAKSAEFGWKRHFHS